MQVAVVDDSPEKRVALGTLSGKLNVGKMYSEPSLLQLFDIALVNGCERKLINYYFIIYRLKNDL